MWPASAIRRSTTFSILDGAGPADTPAFFET
jgi:hypothetical protein